MADAVPPDDNPVANRAATTGIWAASKPVTGRPSIHKQHPAAAEPKNSYAPERTQ
jgi:hypothetical protein